MQRFRDFQAVLFRKLKVLLEGEDVSTTAKGLVTTVANVRKGKGAKYCTYRGLKKKTYCEKRSGIFEVQEKSLTVILFTVTQYRAIWLK